MGQTQTGKSTEHRVKSKLESFGLRAYKPIPDRGVDLVAQWPKKPNRVVNIQVKGRNPKIDPNLRWFQIRVSPSELSIAKVEGLLAEQTWIKKVQKADFFVLVAVKVDEMWVLARDQILELIQLNEHVYRTRPDNVFDYDTPLKQKQKEMNLDIEVEGRKLTEVFSQCKDNFGPILKFLKE